MKKMNLRIIFIIFTLSMTILLANSGMTVAVKVVVPDFSSVNSTPYPLVPYLGNPVLTAVMVKDRVARSVGDPFLFYQGSTWYMFFEVESGIQEIGLATSTNGLNWTYQGIVLAGAPGSWHFAYPNVFQYDGNYFMTPETYDTNSCRLYQASNFPFGWTLKNVIASGRAFVDPQLFYYKDLWWAFVGDTSDGNCYLYYAADLTGRWIEHPKSPIVRGDGLEARGAGRIGMYGGKILRFVEQFDNGIQVGAFQVDTLSKTDFAEHQISSSPLLVPSGAGWNKDAMHHVDPWWTGTMWLAVADGINADTWSIGIYTTLPIPSQITLKITAQPLNITMLFSMDPGTSWIAPAKITTSQRDWFFIKWSDGSTNPTKTFTASGNFTLTYK